MTRFEEKCWEFVSLFGKLPLIFVPILLITRVAYKPTSGTFSDAFQYWLAGHDDGYIYVFLAVCSTILLCYIIGLIIKFCYYKERPIPFFYTNIREKINASSFPSIHTANGVIVMFYGMLASFQYESSAFAGLLMLVWFVYFMGVSLSRIALKRHFVSDVFWGSVLGIICSCVSRFYVNDFMNVLRAIVRFF